MADHLKPYQFQKGMEKIGGRGKGTRNKLSEAFLKDLHAEWERSGAATLKILAVENPAVKALIATIPDDLSIPKFLQRTTNKRAAA